MIVFHIFMGASIVAGVVVHILSIDLSVKLHRLGRYNVGMLIADIIITLILLSWIFLYIYGAVNGW